MKTQLSPLPFGGIIDFSLSPDEIESNLINATDPAWLQLRKQQMDISPNCIFPARHRTSLYKRLGSLRSFLALIVRMPIR